MRRVHLNFQFGWKNEESKNSFFRAVGYLLILAFILNPFSFFPDILGKRVTTEDDLSPKKNFANAYNYVPTGGNLVVGTAQAIKSATTSTANGGANTGSWKGTLADDNFHWVIGSTASGYDFNLVMGGVELKGANAIIIQTEITQTANISGVMQICDWVNSAAVNGAADSQCTTGGWRTINTNRATTNPTTATAYHFQIYDGYWSTGATGGTPISTPLANFVNGSNQVKIRYYSTVSTTTNTIGVDYLRIMPVINPIYEAASSTVITGGAMTGSYASTTIGVGTNMTGSDNSRLTIAGTTTARTQMYLTFENIKTYTGANTILFRSEFACSAASGYVYPTIYNFTTGLWESMVASSTILCFTTDTAHAFAKNNVNLSDYISGGEARIGFQTVASTTSSILIDLAYMMIGTTQTDSDVSEITFGTATSTSATSTRNINTSTSTAPYQNTWNVLAEDENNNMTHAFYAYDNDVDATVEEAVSYNLDFSVKAPNDYRITSAFFAGRYMSGTGGTVQFGMKDYSSLNQATGGWYTIGASATTALTYTDPYTVGTVTAGGLNGLYLNPHNMISATNGKMNLRLRTITDGATTVNSTAQWDFAMVSIQWVEDVQSKTRQYQFLPTAGATTTASTSPSFITAAKIPGAINGTNVGSWKGTLAADNMHWEVPVKPGAGIDFDLTFGSSSPGNANAILFQTTILQRAPKSFLKVQVCDWVSSAGVNGAADSRCTGGGWRNMNTNGVDYSTQVSSTLGFQIYDGYWSTGATGGTPISTPLTNFFDANGNFKVRFYGATTTAASSSVLIDRAMMEAVINPVYMAASSTNLNASSTSLWGSYASTTVGIGLTGSDNSYLMASGTATTQANFYSTFENVRTYTGANTILYSAEYSCSATGANIRPKIWNFTSGLWEDLTNTNIPCSTTDATNRWAKNNITISNYLSSGEMRIGWYTATSSTVAIRIDQQYMMIGTTQTDTDTAEISFGSVSSGSSATSTRTLDMTGTTGSWLLANEDESNTFGHDFYANDTDADAVLEEGTSANLDFSVTSPDNASISGIYFASRHMGGTSVQLTAGIRDYSGTFNTTGGWDAIGSAGTTALTYSDNITASTTATGGFFGYYTNPEDRTETLNNKTNIRLRTSTSGASTTNQVSQWDFAMVSIQWVEAQVSGGSLTLSLDSNSESFGTLTPGTPVYGSTTATVTTTNASGFNIAVNRVLPTATLDLNTNSAITIPDKTAWVPGGSCAVAGNATASSTSPQTLQFRVMSTGTDSSNYCSAWWGSNDSNALFAGFPTSAQQIMNRTSASTPSTATVIQYYLDTTSSQSSGAYSGDITVTATVNP